MLTVDEHVFFFFSSVYPFALVRVDTPSALLCRVSCFFAGALHGRESRYVNWRKVLRMARSKIARSIGIGLLPLTERNTGDELGFQ